jgi:hypothetical protein
MNTESMRAVVLATLVGLGGCSTEAPPGAGSTSDDPPRCEPSPTSTATTPDHDAPDHDTPDHDTPPGEARAPRAARLDVAPPLDLAAALRARRPTVEVVP